MALLNIISFPDPILRIPAKEVATFDEEIASLVSDMAETMYDAPGIGLAAPQVGISKRIAVIDLGEDEETQRKSKLHVLINPIITKNSGHIKYEEGCLSISGIREFVERPSEISVSYQNEKGENLELEASGLMAVCIQHEIDHLDGILFIDRLTSLKKKITNKKLIKLFGTSKG